MYQIWTRQRVAAGLAVVWTGVWLLVRALFMPWMGLAWTPGVFVILYGIFMASIELGCMTGPGERSG